MSSNLLPDDKGSVKKIAATFFGQIVVGVIANYVFRTIEQTENIDPETLRVIFILFLVLCQILVVFLVIKFTKNPLERRIEELELGYDSRDMELAKSVHGFVHRVRDLSVILHMNDLPKNINSRAEKSIIANPFENRIQEMLISMIRTYKVLVPRDTKLFAVIRELKPDRTYQTVLRAGDFRPDRNEKSEGMRYDSPMIQDLLQAINRNRDCVIRTGPGYPNWKEMPNDKLGEDKSVLLGAVFSKVWNPKIGIFSTEDRRLEWVLCLAADRENVFDKPHHLELMKTFNDSLGILLNWFARYEFNEPG